MNDIMNGAVTIATMIVGAALLALIVSKKSQSANVITSVGEGFSRLLGTALAPIVQNGVNAPIALYH